MAGTISQTEILTPRLRLRAFEQTDIHDVYGYASDPRITEFLLWDTHRTLKVSQQFLEWVTTVTSGKIGSVFFVYAIELVETGRVIGSIDLKNVNPFVGQLDYVVARHKWGKGIATEAVTRLKDWAFDTLPNMVRLQIYCQPENTASRRVIEKAGLQFEGCLRRSFVIKWQPVDVLYFSEVRARNWMKQSEGSNSGHAGTAMFGDN